MSTLADYRAALAIVKGFPNEAWKEDPPNAELELAIEVATGLGLGLSDADRATYEAERAAQRERTWSSEEIEARAEEERLSAERLAVDVLIEDDDTSDG